MKLIDSSVQIIEEKDPYKLIELAGRTCYKSENNITDNSAKEFVDHMIKLGHGAMLEHGTIYLTIAKTAMNIGDPVFYIKNKYSEVKEDNLFYYITTNMRVLVENNRMNDLQYKCEPTEYHEKRITVKFICDRCVAQDFTRHRVFSFAMESTRYCNYSKDKFNNELTFIKPTWWNEMDDIDKEDWCTYLSNAEQYYLNLINKRGWQAQKARQILPLDLKTELIMTGFESDWDHYFELRNSSKAHPNDRKLAKELNSIWSY